MDRSKVLPDGELYIDTINLDLNIQIITTLFSAVSFVIPGAFRVFYMLIPIQMTLVPNMLAIIYKKNMRYFVSGILIVLYIVIFSYLILFYNQNATLPYHTIFTK